MIFNINEARNEVNQLAKKNLPVRNPKDYVEYKWTRKDIVGFCNAKDTKKLRRIIDGYIADGEKQNPGSPKNGFEYDIKKAVDKSDDAAVYLCKIGERELYYLKSSNTTVGIVKDSLWPHGYDVERHLDGDPVKTIKKLLAEIK